MMTKDVFHFVPGGMTVNGYIPRVWYASIQLLGHPLPMPHFALRPHSSDQNRTSEWHIRLFVLQGEKSARGTKQIVLFRVSFVICIALIYIYTYILFFLFFCSRLCHRSNKDVDKVRLAHGLPNRHMPPFIINTCFVHTSCETMCGSRFLGYSCSAISILRQYELNVIKWYSLRHYIYLHMRCHIMNYICRSIFYFYIRTYNVKKKNRAIAIVVLQNATIQILNEKSFMLFVTGDDGRDLYLVKIKMW